jgi:hypothetical protein
MARVPERSEEVFRRMSQGEYGTVCRPNLTSCNMLFKAYKGVGDPQGMLR